MGSACSKRKGSVHHAKTAPVPGSAPLINITPSGATVGAQPKGRDQNAMDAIIEQGQVLTKNKNTTVIKTMYNVRGKVKEVVLKILTMESVEEMGSFLTEVRNTDKLAHLPRVVTVHDVQPQTSQSGEQFQLILIEEFADLGSLDNEIVSRYKRQQKWEEKQLLCFLLNWVEVHAKAQEMGIAHRDIKPANVLLFSTGEMKICDFGVSKEVSSNTVFRTITGTPPYFSYELVEAYKRSAQSGRKQDTVNWFLNDVVSLALMVVNMMMLTEGIKLNDLSDDAVAKQASAFSQLTMYSDGFKGILKRMLTVNPKNRPDFIQLFNELKVMNIEQVSLISPEAMSGNKPVTSGPVAGLEPTMAVENNTVRHASQPLGNAVRAGAAAFAGSVVPKLPAINAQPKSPLLVEPTVKKTVNKKTVNKKTGKKNLKPGPTVNKSPLQVPTQKSPRPGTTTRSPGPGATQKSPRPVSNVGNRLDVTMRGSPAVPQTTVGDASMDMSVTAPAAVLNPDPVIDQVAAAQRIQIAIAVFRDEFQSLTSQEARNWVQDHAEHGNVTEMVREICEYTLRENHRQEFDTLTKAMIEQVIVGVLADKSILEKITEFIRICTIQNIFKKNLQSLATKAAKDWVISHAKTSKLWDIVLEVCEYHRREGKHKNFVDLTKVQTDQVVAGILAEKAVGDKIQLSLRVVIVCTIFRIEFSNVADKKAKKWVLANVTNVRNLREVVKHFCEYHARESKRDHFKDLTEAQMEEVVKTVIADKVTSDQINEFLRVASIKDIFKKNFNNLATERVRTEVRKRTVSGNAKNIVREVCEYYKKAGQREEFKELSGKEIQQVMTSVTADPKLADQVSGFLRIPAVVEIFKKDFVSLESEKCKEWVRKNVNIANRGALVKGLCEYHRDHDTGTSKLKKFCKGCLVLLPCLKNKLKGHRKEFKHISDDQIAKVVEQVLADRTIDAKLQAYIESLRVLVVADVFRDDFANLATEDLKKQVVRITGEITGKTVVRELCKFHKGKNKNDFKDLTNPQIEQLCTRVLADKDTAKKVSEFQAAIQIIKVVNRFKSEFPSLAIEEAKKYVLTQAKGGNLTSNVVVREFWNFHKNKGAKKEFKNLNHQMIDQVVDNVMNDSATAKKISDISATLRGSAALDTTQNQSVIKSPKSQDTKVIPPKPQDTRVTPRRKS